MNNVPGATHVGPRPDDARDTRHAVEQANLKARTDLAAAQARTAGEWFDIFLEIVISGVRQTMEANGSSQEDFSAKMRDQDPYNKVVRGKFEAHGLPITEEIDFEGPDVKHDELGMPHNVSWPRGVWVEFYWPAEGRQGDRLRFEGQAALTALSFILWWVGFNQVAMHMAGKSPEEKARLVQPGSNEYLSYIDGKERDRPTRPNGV